MTSDLTLKKQHKEKSTVEIEIKVLNEGVVLRMLNKIWKWYSRMGEKSCTFNFLRLWLQTSNATTESHSTRLTALKNMDSAQGQIGVEYRIAYVASAAVYND